MSEQRSDSPSSAQVSPSDDNRKAIISDCAELSRVIATEPGQMTSSIVECLSSYLLYSDMGKFSRATLRDQLGELLGAEGPARFLVTCLSMGDAKVANSLEEHLDIKIDETVHDLLKTLFIRFGDTIYRADRAWQSPRDWSRLRVHVGNNQEKKESLITVRVERNDGQVVEFAGSIGSLIRAKTILVERLSEDLATIDENDQTKLKALHEKLSELVTKFCAD